MYGVYLGVLAMGAALLLTALFLRPQNKMFELPSLSKSGQDAGNNHPVHSNSEYDCGPVALKMILDYYNIPATLNEVEENIDRKGKGASMLSLKQFAESKGLHADGWRFTVKDLLRTTFPVILYVNRNHYVVADSVCRDTIFLRDPTLGRFLLPAGDLSNIWKGETLIFYFKK